jgi:Xaa-Pro aminopeptidase
MPTHLLIADSDDPNLRHAAGVRVNDHIIWIRAGEGKKPREFIITSGLEFARIRQETKPGTKVVLFESIDCKNVRKPVGRRKNLADIAASWLLANNLTDIIVPDNMWAIYVETLREQGIRVRYQSPYFPQRMVKSPLEISAIKATGVVAKKALREAISLIKSSTIDWDDTLVLDGKRLTSEYVRMRIEQVFLAHGCASGETIVSCGDESALPHHHGTGPLRAGEPIVIDIFPRDTTSGYFFDMTRTIVKGTPRPELRKLYATVLRAQLAGLAAVKPGRKCSEVHAAVQSVFTRAGYKTTDEEGFIHSTGHGLGLAIHEGPSVSTRSDDVLRPGMVITIEPGLYYKDTGGVRIEDTVLVTAKGMANLTNVPTTFLVK